jgi:hypothetical protein
MRVRIVALKQFKVHGWDVGTLNVEHAKPFEPLG